MLIRGDKLTSAQRILVLAGFPYRWTHENAVRRYGGECPACIQRYQCEPNATRDVNGVPWHQYHVRLTSDREWLQLHAFHFVKDGSRLMAKQHAEPHYMADTA